MPENPTPATPAPTVKAKPKPLPEPEALSFIDRWRQRVPTKQKVIFSRQLATLVNAGLPLVQSLTNVQSQTSNKSLKAATGDIVTAVEGGSSLANALSRHPNIFDQVYISLVAAGEASGTLDVSLNRLANQQEKDSEIVGRIRGALLYPLIVLGVLIAVVIFMMIAVLPQVQTLYNQFPGVSLPTITRALLAVAHGLIHLWWIVILFLIGAGYLLRRWINGVKGRQSFDLFKMRAWPAGQLFMKLYMARFARTLSTLVAAGVPLIQALQTTSKAIGNVQVAASINAAAESVKGGKTLAASIAHDHNFLELVPNMIQIGEQSGTLDDMLGKLADYYEKEVDSQIRTISSVIEPVLMVCVGVLALIVVAAVLLPIYSLAGKGLGGSSGL